MRSSVTREPGDPTATLKTTESERQMRHRQQLVELEDRGCPQYLLIELDGAYRQLDQMSERLSETAATLQRRLRDVVAHVSNGDSVNSLGEVQGQGGSVDVLCASYMGARERVERAVGAVGRWESNHALAVVQEQRRDREPAAVLRVVFDRPASADEITSLAADIAENYSRPTVLPRRQRDAAFVTTCTIVEPQS